MKSLAMIFFACCVVFPAFGAVYSGGAGTAESPYQIGSVADWTTLTETPDDWDKHFVLTADIDFGGAEIGMVGSSSVFSGAFDGNGHVLKNPQVNGSDRFLVGIFGAIDSGALIANLGAENVVVTGSRSGTVEGIPSINVGGLVGGLLDLSLLDLTKLRICESRGMSQSVRGCGIISCYTTGVVSGTGNSSSSTVGGLVGYALGGLIDSCHTTSSVSGDGFCGGLVGSNVGSITDSYATGAVSGQYCGGLVGGNGGSITDSYATGAVSAGLYGGGMVGINTSDLSKYVDDGPVIRTSCAVGDVMGIAGEDSIVAGLVGYSDGRIEECYAVCVISGDGYYGGLVGENQGAITSSYWNIERSGVTTSAGGEGRTTDEMTYPHAENTYVDWDFENVWAEDVSGVNGGYPYLREEVPSTEGEPTEGEPTDGEPTEGEIPEGQTGEGETPEGLPAEGQVQEGAPAEGQAGDGEPADGEAAEGQKPISLTVGCSGA